MVTLAASFAGIFESLGMPQPIALRDELLAMYQSPGRYYHNEKHLLHCLQELGDSPDRRQPAIELALWFHDAIYDAQRRDNEQRSAQLAEERLAALSVDHSLVVEVKRLILATTHKSAPERPDEQLIVDVDLAILGQAENVFDLYELNIRKEYSHVPDAHFRAGRAAVLRHFLERKTIYHTPHFHAKYEVQARRNLARSLATLTR